MRVWNQLNDKFQALSVREKWLIAAGITVTLIVLLHSMLIEPAVVTAHSKQRQLTMQQDQIQNQAKEIELLKRRLQVNPDEEIDNKLQQLSERSLALSEQLAAIVDSLITPQQMAGLLETVLSSSNKLKLEALESLPPEAVLTGNKPVDDANNAGSSAVGYYIHPVRIELTGRYFDIKNYLETLETMPVKYYWRSFSYQVETYPEARLILEVYTLGTRQEFIGG
ncbi:MSHA biogenesis protein MshJ [Vibrio sp. HA2012]|uniref:type II secretion system protein GspM n=1 Tax=Vibrio sp. HA2012 TaxID=1971595 RepID=UPI000C2CA950|nr:type II secretion system protein GspM [Vibrio sp. HA2012]PJC85567.1 MSHA biogenesis protein MshJ [Vibrio sp. HA2012]